jgi:hypothetical protein
MRDGAKARRVKSRCTFDLWPLRFAGDELPLAGPDRHSLGGAIAEEFGEIRLAERQGDSGLSRVGSGLGVSESEER